MLKKNTILMAQDHRNRILRAMLYLEQNLTRGPNIEELAEVACFSPFHFQRIFQSCVGETIGQFQQRKRYEKALALLSKSNLSMIDIAFEVGYETPAALNKLFMRFSGMSPSTIKKELKSKCLEDLYPAACAATTYAKKEGMMACIQTYGERHFYYQVISGIKDGNFMESSSYAFNSLFKWAMEKGIIKEITSWMGMFPNQILNYYDDEAVFWLGFSLPKMLDVDSPFPSLRMSEGKVASFIHYGSYEYLIQSWNHIYHNWYPSSQFQLRDTHPYEEYMTNPNKVEPESNITQIVIPIH